MQLYVIGNGIRTFVARDTPAISHINNSAYFHKLHWVSFESLLASHTTEIIRFSVVSDLKL